MIDETQLSEVRKLVKASGDRFDFGGLPLPMIFDTLEKLLKVARAAKDVEKDMDINERSFNAAKQGFVGLRHVSIERVKIFLRMSKALDEAGFPHKVQIPKAARL